MSGKGIRCGGLFIFLLSGLFISSAFCDPNNGRFELYDYNETLQINSPSYWYHDSNYAEVVEFLTPRSPLWKLKTDLLPFEGDYFLLISTGIEDTSTISEDSQGSKVWQSINAEAGNKLTGVYFFGTMDYSWYVDWGEIKLIPLENPNEAIEVVYVTVEDVGSYGSGDKGSMSGWKKFEYTFETTGVYELNISVNDYYDSSFDSFLAVDGVALCRNPSGEGDFNCDCTVNFEDFAFLAADWLCDCNDPDVLNDPESDPDFYNDPNSNCLLGTDMNKNGPVNFADLKIMSENWLDGIKE